MVKIIGDVKFNHEVEHYVFNLENGDQVLVHERDLENDIIHESVQENKYWSVFSEREYSDDPINIIGFKLAE